MTQEEIIETIQATMLTHVVSFSDTIVFLVRDGNGESQAIARKIEDEESRKALLLILTGKRTI